jgi:hypothetical protein
VKAIPNKSIGLAADAPEEFFVFPNGSSSRPEVARMVGRRSAGSSLGVRQLAQSRGRAGRPHPGCPKVGEIFVVLVTSGQRSFYNGLFG